MAPVDATTQGGVPPWPRSPHEIDEAFAVLGVQMQQIAARPQRTVEQLSAGEHYALGVRAAALWTTGRTATAPLTDEVQAADVSSVITVMALAEYLMTAAATPAQVVAVAGGVRAWLVWLIGAEDRMAFPTLE